MRTIHIQDRAIELALKELESSFDTKILEIRKEIGSLPSENSSILEAKLSIPLIYVSNDYTASSEESGVLVDTTLKNITIKLKNSPVDGRVYIVSNRGSNSVIIDGNGKTINDEETFELRYFKTTVYLVYNKDKGWVIV